ncbi:hypothetical protein KY362_00830 [Candidatus Woesearchaeota archaeon]|nr:hypothetical protein [Candidatus Woesearchaeota archaeon]
MRRDKMGYEGRSEDAYAHRESVEKQFFGFELENGAAGVRESYAPKPSVEPEEFDPEVEFFGEPLEQRVRD